jgi:MFS family permease
MQQLSEQDVQAAQTNTRPRQHKNSARRKITVRLSEGVCGRLDVATDRPGVGKSMFVEAALDHFLTPAPSTEDLVRDRFDRLHDRFDRLEGDLRTMAEIVALHARYQLAVTPPVPEERQREAVRLGDERFKVFAEQVERRVREVRPLMQETIDRAKAEADRRTKKAAREQDPSASGTPKSEQKHKSDRVEATQIPQSIAGEGLHDGNVQRDPIASGEHDRQRYTRTDRLLTSKEGEPAPTAKPRFARDPSISNWRLILAVFLPFAAGYYLSFLFRTINAAIFPALAAEFGLDASKTGLMTSVYFLVLAGAQIPIGAFLDRYGPRRVQSVLLVLAAGGATLFGTAAGLAELLAGRALIGLGVAASLMAGLKATVIWFPRERIAFVNGWMIMLGSLGAVTATAPTDWVVEWAGWRSLFELLTFATVSVAAAVYWAVPEKPEQTSRSTESYGAALTVRSVLTDARFLRIAPLSAACIGSSWALQSLWAAPWLSDVESLDRRSVMTQLLVMSIALSVAALMLGTLADRLRKRGITAEMLLGAVAAIFVIAQLAIILRVPLPSLLPWCIVSVMGAGTVLSFAIVADYFPQQVAARANGALNLLHFGWAFAAQCGVGLIVAQWLPDAGRYPVQAYQVAFAIMVAVQIAALLWFVAPWLRSLSSGLLPMFAGQNQGNHPEFATEPGQGVLQDMDEGRDW